MEPPLVPVASARRLLLGAQGLLDDPAGRATPAQVRRRIERMGFVQVDTINAVERAHHHILQTRFDDYRPRVLARLLERERTLFEHWTHDAAILPTALFAHWKHRFAWFARPDHRWGRWLRRRMKPKPSDVVAHVRERIEREGPLMSRDFADERPAAAKAAGWWNWKPQKTALEYLWRTGELCISGRVNFHKVYELTGRWLPEHHARPEPPREEHVDWACRAALERLGVATPREIWQFFDLVRPDEVRHWCARARETGQIVDVRVAAADGSAPRAALAFPDWKRRAARLPDAPARTRLLNPFDPVLRDRERAKRLFGFDYRFEAFTPEKKRRYGYYVLPVLEGERLVGRIDPKHERERGVLEVRRVWWEPGVRVTRKRRKALEDACERFAQQIGAGSARLPKERGGGSRGRG